MENPNHRYRIERELGRGAMGQVYLARDQEAGGRLVALKFLTPARGPAAEKRLRRFQREGEALARFRHPHVVAIHGVGESQGRAYLVLDYVEGENLEDRLERDGPLPSRDAAKLVRSLADAMEDVHRAGVLHRDIKPANVLLREHDGIPLLTDFGLTVDIAGDQTRLTADGTFLGTPGYMSPEQASGKLAAFGPATDVYSLGALLYAVLTGRPPLIAGDLFQALVQVMELVPEPPSAWVPSVDPELDRICLRCLAKDPSKRFADAGALREALDAYLKGLRTTNLRPPTWVAVAAALALLGLAGGAVLAGLQEPPPRAETPPHTASPTQKVDPQRAIRREAVRLALLGLKHHRAGRLQEALDCYDRALALHESRAVYHNRSNLKQSLKDLDGALEDLDESIRLEEGVANLAERAILLRLRGRGEEALRDFSRALELEEDRQVLYQRGETLRQLGQRQEALSDARRLRELAPRSADGYLIEIQILESENRQQEALALTAAAAKVAPDDPAVIACVARLSLHFERWREGRDAADRLLTESKSPQRVSFLRIRGIARMRLGDVAGGRADLELFLERCPTSPYVPQVRAELQFLDERAR